MQVLMPASYDESALLTRCLTIYTIKLWLMKLDSANYFHLICCYFLRIQDTTEAYLDSCKTSKMDFFTKIVYGFFH